MHDPLPTPPQTSSAKSLQPNLVVKEVLKHIALFVILAISFSNIIECFDIFAKVETILYIALVSSPLAVFIYSKIKTKLQKHLNSLVLPVFIPVFALTTIIIVLIANMQIDGSLPEHKNFMVIEKHSSLYDGTITYYVDINRPEFIDLPFNFSNTETIEIGKNEYLRTIPKKTHINLSYHMGALGIPWYSEYVMNMLAPSAISEPTATNKLSQSSDITEACLWTTRFNIDQEIEKITPDNYFRDYWNGTQPRSVEPMVNGQRHGIGHYTFANGAVYGDIPWKNGQKHGVFTLYREDGTKEQKLSYKNGKIYGIQEWYDSRGNISQTYVYDQNEKPRSISLCPSKS